MIIVRLQDTRLLYIYQPFLYTSKEQIKFEITNSAIYANKNQNTYVYLTKYM